MLPIQCPHCQGEIVLKLRIPPPESVGVYKAEDEDVANIMNKLKDTNDNPKEPETIPIPFSS